jgi:nitrous oxide reductase accessory protein NosL
MIGRALLLLTTLLLASLTGCDSDPGSGPVSVKWDRDVCERCRMVLSDRHFAAQIRVPPDVLGKRGKVLRFDDIGCAVLWLDQQPWKDRPGIEIWVNDHRDGAWIDARTAHYVAVKNTPMEYGLGAQKEPSPGALGFSDAVAHIYDVEKRFAADGTVTIPHPPTAVESR